MAPPQHRSEVICVPDAGVSLQCILNLAGTPHWQAPLGGVVSLNQINAAWAYHLQQESEDRDG